MRRYLLVGLTGSIATGKSTVSDMFRTLGAVVLDADVLAREVVAPGEPALAQIVEEFGREVLLPDGSLDRKKLGALVFGDAARRRRLEEITHPAIRARFLKHLADLEARGFAGIVIWDAAVLIETGGHKAMDRLIVVATDEAIQAARLRARDAVDAAEAERKIRSQMPVAEKAKLADYVIDNAGARTGTQLQVGAVYEGLVRELSTARHLTGHAMPLAALFPVNMGHYAANRIDVASAFGDLRRGGTGADFVAYHRNPSGNFLFAEAKATGVEGIRAAAEKVLMLECVGRRFSDLIQVLQAVPSAATLGDRSVRLIRDGREMKVIVVFLSREVPASARSCGSLGARVSVLRWVSGRDVLCLYDRPRRNGSVGQVRQALLRSITQKTAEAGLSGTARAVGVVRDLVAGDVKIAEEGRDHASTP